MFNKQLYIQNDSGSIGVKATGLFGEVRMTKWCLKFVTLLKKLKIQNDILKRFVDDVSLLPTVIDPGMEFVDGKLVLNENKVESDKEIPDDERTMRIIQKIANSIDPHIQVTYDVQSNYSDKMVPILDIKATVNSDNEIDYIFYQKEISNRLVTLKDAAMTNKQKFDILTQQCFRRIHNTRETLQDDVKKAPLDRFMNYWKLSGYKENDRKNLLTGGLETFRKKK